MKGEKSNEIWRQFKRNKKNKKDISGGTCGKTGMIVNISVRERKSKTTCSMMIHSRIFEIE